MANKCWSLDESELVLEPRLGFKPTFPACRGVFAGYQRRLSLDERGTVSKRRRVIPEDIRTYRYLLVPFAGSQEGYPVAFALACWRVFKLPHLLGVARWIPTIDLPGFTPDALARRQGSGRPQTAKLQILSYRDIVRKSSMRESNSRTMLGKHVPYH